MWILRRSHNHINAETLSEYIDVRLTGTAAARVERQLSGCTACQEELESLRSTVGMLRDMREPVPSRSFSLEAPPPARETRPRPRRPIRLRPQAWVSLTPQWAYAGIAATAALVLALLVSADVTGLLAPSPGSMEEAGVESAASTVAGIVREAGAPAQDQSAPTLRALEGPSSGSAEPASAPAARTQSAPDQPPDQPPEKGDTPPYVRPASTARPEPASHRAAQPEQAVKWEVANESAIVPNASESAPPVKAESPAVAAPGSAAPQTATTAISAPAPKALPEQPEAQRIEAVMVAEEVDTAGTQTPAPPTPSPAAQPAPTKPTPVSEPTSNVPAATAIPTPMPTVITEQEHEQTSYDPPGAEIGARVITVPDSAHTALIWRILEGTVAALCLVFLAIFIIRLRAPRPTPGS